MPQLPTFVATTDLPWSYTVAAGMQPLTLPNPAVFTAGRALGVSTDGTYIVGLVSYGNPPNASRNRAVVWINGVPQMLALLSGGSAAEAAAVSDDKSTIVGQCKDSNGHVKAVKWIASGGVFGVATLLGDLHSGSSNYAQGVNSDGTIIYGSALDGSGTRFHYVKWVSGVLTMIFTNTQDYVFGTNYLAGDTVYYLGADYEATEDNNGAIAPNAGAPWNNAAVDAAAFGVSQNGVYSCGLEGGDGIPVIHAGPMFNGAVVNEWLTTNETLKVDSWFTGVSNDGICAGFSYDDALTNIFATFWHGPSTLTLLDHGTSTTNRAFAIASDSSQIAGVAQINSHSRAVTWAKTGSITYGSMTNLGVMTGGTYSVGQGTGISTVVGYGDITLPAPFALPGAGVGVDVDPPAFDNLFMVTQGVGTVPHWVERSSKMFDQAADTLADAWFLDGAVQATKMADSGGTGAKLYGLWHLRGLSGVTAFINGVDCGDFTIASDGTLFVPYGGLFTSATGKALVGYTYTSQGQLLRPMLAPDAGAANGPALGKTRRLHMWTALFVNTIGAYVGTTFANLRKVVFRTPGGTAYPATEMFNGVHQNTAEDDYDFDGMLCWQVTRPYPVTISTIGGFIHTQDR